MKDNKCPKGHKTKWIGFFDKKRDGSLGKYNNLLPPHALLFCKDCGISYKQRPIYLDREGVIRIQLGKTKNHGK